MPQSAPPFTTIRRQFSFVTLGANLVGALLTFLYLALIDPLPIAVETAEDLQGSSIIFVVLLLVLFSIGILWNGRVTARIGRWYDQLQQGQSSSDVPAEISRDVLHFVLRSTLTSAALWTTAGTYYAFDSTDPLRTLIGIVGVGGV
ncbi:MAG: hypothetical protein M3380_18975, partial [Chloroflexota bacterium]|nr:hypothetical protein [Chloroflexota bacterium]